MSSETTKKTQRIPTKFKWKLNMQKKKIVSFQIQLWGWRSKKRPFPTVYVWPGWLSTNLSSSSGGGGGGCRWYTISTTNTFLNYGGCSFNHFIFVRCRMNELNICRVWKAGWLDRIFFFISNSYYHQLVRTDCRTASS